MGLWNRRTGQRDAESGAGPDAEPVDEALDEDFIQDALRLGRGEILTPRVSDTPAPEASPQKDTTPVVPVREPAGLDPRSRITAPPAPPATAPPALPVTRNEPADLDPRSRITAPPALPVPPVAPPVGRGNEPADLDPRSRIVPPVAPAKDPADLDPRSRRLLPSARGDEPDELDPRTPLVPSPHPQAAIPGQRDEPKAGDPLARHLGRTNRPETPGGESADNDVKAKLAAVEEERDRERQAAADARKLLKSRFEQASAALEAAEAEKTALAERLARAETQAGNVGDAHTSLQAAKAENARLAERVAAAERDATQALDAAEEWQRRYTQAEAALEVARQQAALASGRAANEADELATLRDELLDVRAERKRWEKNVLDQASQIEQLKSALLQAEERHIKEMDEFLESLRTPRSD